MTDTEIKTRLTDLYAVALTIYGEAAGEPVEGKVFVGCIIRNRVKHPKRFGNTYMKVCLARAQFSCWWLFGGKENYNHLMSMTRAIVMGGPNYPLTTPVDAAYTECLFIAEGIIGGQLRDNSKGCTHYMTRALFKADPPEWAKGKTPDVQVGNHVGFRGIA